MSGEVGGRRFATPWGRMAVAATLRGLVRVVLPGCDAGEIPRGRGSAAAARHLDRAERQMGEYLAGRRRTFALAVDLSDLPPFRRKVLAACRDIPYGATTTYGRLAARVGRPRAARAVGQAMATNPVPLVIPCHRVLAADGGLAGFMGRTRGCGVALKRRLLTLEGVRPVGP